MKNLKAVIFDMDGTLVDNIAYHRMAWMSFLEKHKIFLDPQQFHAQNHGNIDEMIRRFFGENLPHDKVVELGQEKELTYKNLYRNHIKEVNGLSDFLNTLDEKGIKTALATNSDDRSIDFILDGLKLKHTFAALVGGLEVKKGKPDPEIFYLTMSKLQLNSDDCIVIEDSVGGVISAKKAGIAVVGLTTSHTAQELEEYGCLFAVSDFNELNNRLLDTSNKQNNIQCFAITSRQHDNFSPSFYKKQRAKLT